MIQHFSDFEDGEFLTLRRAVGEVYQDVLQINYQVKSPEAVIDSLVYEFNTDNPTLPHENRLGRFASVAAAHEGDDELEGVQRVHGGILELIGISIGVTDEPIELSVAGVELAKIYPLVPDIEDASIFGSYLDRLGPRGMNKIPSQHNFVSDILANLDSRVSVLEENKKVFEREGMLEFIPTTSLRLTSHFDNFRAVMPQYYNSNFAEHSAYRSLERRLLSRTL